MIKYSIIIPFHSNINLLTMCVSKLVETMNLNESEIIIVDNNAKGSQINSDFQFKNECKILYKKENLMYPRAINLGVENAEGEYLIFCDADTCVTSNFYKPLTKVFLDDSIGYSSAKLLNIHTNNIQEFGITSSYYNFPHPFSGRKSDFELIKNNHYPLAACAACSSIKRNLYIDIGGFDEELIHSYSDIDLCIRLKEKGYKTVCVANSIAYHCGSSTTESGMSSSLKEDTKGIFHSKHKQIPVQITEYIDKASDFFLKTINLDQKDYLVFDCSTIGNSDYYIDTIIRNLELNKTMYYRHPYPIRDAQTIDLLNFIPHTIRNYKVPILYFTDSFSSFLNNSLWKECRKNYNDIVFDRNANIELLQNI